MKKLLLTLTLAFGAFTASAAATNAATYTVNTTADTTTCDSTSCSLRGAIINANANPGNHIIQFQGTAATNTYTLSLTSGTNDEDYGDLDVTNTTGTIQILGNGQSGTVIDANQIDRVFELAAGTDVQFVDLTIMNGLVPESGAGIKAAGGVTLSQVAVTNNRTDSTNLFQGGGISTDSSNVAIHNSTFTGNTSRYGGAGYFYNSIVNLENSTVDSNLGISYTGGFAFDSSTYQITDSTFSNNSGRRYSAVSDSSSTGNISNTTFDANAATYNGGAISSLTSCTNVDNSTFTSNTSAGTGAAMYFEYPSCATTIENIVFDSNTASAMAGALFIQSSTNLVVRDSSFTSNVAGTNGGAIVIFGQSQVQSSEFIDNEAGNAGGAIYVSGQYQNGNGNVDITQSHFELNTAIDGGAINATSATARVLDSVFMDSAGTNGAAVSYASSSATDQLYIYRTQFIGTDPNSTVSSLIRITSGIAEIDQSIIARAYVTSTLLYNGGGDLTIQKTNVNRNYSAGNMVYSYNGQMHILDSRISTNTAASTAGGLRISGGSATIERTRIQDNIGYYAGGVYAHGSTIVAIDNSIIDGNTSYGSSGAGGGLRVESGNFTIENSTISNNYAENSIGGGIHNDSANTTIQNTTITGNKADSSGSAISISSGGVDVYFSTIVDNIGNADQSISYASYSGNALYLNQSTSSLHMGYTILENNTDGFSGNDVSCYVPSGSATSAGYNMFSDSPCSGFTTASTDTVSTAAGVGTLQNNGGFSPTMALTSSSQAIDAIPVATCNTVLALDQRGIIRANGSTTGSACDIGAYEYES